MDQFTKIYRVEFGNETAQYIVAPCFSQVAKHFEGKYTTNITLIAASDNGISDDIGGVNLPLPLFSIVSQDNPDVKNWGEALKQMGAKGVVLSADKDNDALFELVQEFRDWNKAWALYDNNEGSKLITTSVSDFIKYISHNYEIIRK